MPRTVDGMTKPSGGFAPEADGPGEFNAGPGGIMAREKGVPPGLDGRYTEAQRRAGLIVPPLPISAIRQAQAERATSSEDEFATPDPLSFGS